jgi:DNA-directed RNA polymerase beta subunit
MAIIDAPNVQYPRNRRQDTLPLPDLIEIQTKSYQWFLDEGLRELFENFSSIEDYTGNLSLDFLDYRIGEPTLSIAECRERDATYETPIHAKVRLVNKETGEINESEVYMGELPVMTDRGTFLINGAERVVISQLSRSPGVYFRDIVDSAGRVLHAAHIIPNEGAWVEIETAASGMLTVRIGQTRKFPVTVLLRALDWFEDVTDDLPPTGTDTEILDAFGIRETIALKQILKEIKDGDRGGMPGAQAQDVFYATSRHSGPEGEVLVEAYGKITEPIANGLRKTGTEQVAVSGWVIFVWFAAHGTAADGIHTQLGQRCRSRVAYHRIGRYHLAQLVQVALTLDGLGHLDRTRGDGFALRLAFAPVFLASQTVHGDCEHSDYGQHDHHAYECETGVSAHPGYLLRCTPVGLNYTEGWMAIRGSPY